MVQVSANLASLHNVPNAPAEACDACGAPLDPFDKFCGACGAARQARQAASQPSLSGPAPREVQTAAAPLGIGQRFFRCKNCGTEVATSTATSVEQRGLV